MALTDNTKKFLDSILKLAADGASYAPGSAQDYIDYITTNVGTVVNEQTTKATPQEWVDDTVFFANATAAEFGNANVQKLVTDLGATVTDAEHAAYMKLVGDAIQDYKDIRGLIKK